MGYFAVEGRSDWGVTYLRTPLKYSTGPLGVAGGHIHTPCSTQNRNVRYRREVPSHTLPRYYPLFNKSTLHRGGNRASRPRIYHKAIEATRTGYGYDEASEPGLDRVHPAGGEHSTVRAICYSVEVYTMKLHVLKL